MTPRHDARPVLWCLAAAALFGASTPASKALLDGIGPLTLAGLLYLGAALGVAPFTRRGAAPGAWRDRANMRRLLAAVVFGGILGPVALLFGLQLAPAGSVALWLNLETVATAILAWAFFREHLDRRVVLAALLVLAGGVLLAAPDGFGRAVPALLVAAACACWGLDNNVTALIGGFTPAQTTFAKGAVAGAFNLTLGLALERAPAGPGVVLLALLVGALSYGLSIALYVAGAQLLGAMRSQLVFSTSPFLGLLLAWAWLREPFGPATVAAGALMALGVALLLTTEHEHDHDHERQEHSHGHRHDDDHHDHVHPGLPAWTWHVHPHVHEPHRHAHAHHPDLHHRHDHA
jgi:drug/metabolite transporter (DMT)-like permease